FWNITGNDEMCRRKVKRNKGDEQFRSSFRSDDQYGRNSCLPRDDGHVCCPILWRGINIFPVGNNRLYRNICFNWNSWSSWCRDYYAHHVLLSRQPSTVRNCFRCWC